MMRGRVIGWAIAVVLCMPQMSRSPLPRWSTSPYRMTASAWVSGNTLAIAVSLSLRLYLPTRVGFFDQHRLAAAVVGIVAATGISFSMSRWIVFTRRGDRNPPAHFPPQTHIGRSSAVV